MDQRSTPYRLGSAMSGNKSRALARDISESLGKLPPQAMDLEEAVLGAVMLETDALMQTISILRPDDFYSDQHKEIYQAIWDLYHDDKPSDMRTVVNRLRKNGKLEIVGGAYYIAELTSKVSSAANIEYHCRLLIEFKIKREIIQIASQAHHDAYDDPTDALELLDKVQQSLDKVGGQYLKGNFQSAEFLAMQFMRDIKEKEGHKGLTGTASGFTLIDKVTGGWQVTDLIIVAARPGMGKTAFLLSTALNTSLRLNVPTAIFSLEMSSKQLMARAHSAESEIVNEKVFKNYLDDADKIRLEYASSKIRKSPLYIDDTPAISIYEFRARARRLVHEHGVKVIYVDYLQLMKGEDGVFNRDQEIGSISRGLKRVAKELNVPVIALSQLSRGVETRGGDKRPQLSDLRESGSIEQDADIVMFLYRPEYYKISEFEDGRPTQGVMEVIIAKHRNGSIETVPLKFLGRFTKVMDWSDGNEPTPQPAQEQRLIPMAQAIRDITQSQGPQQDDDMPF